MRDIAKIAYRALSDLEAMGIAPSPDCFNVWYMHISKESPELTSEIQRLLQAKSGISEQQLKALAAKYLCATSAFEKNCDFTDQLKASAFDLRSIAGRLNDVSAGIENDTNAALEGLKDLENTPRASLEIIHSLCKGMKLSMHENEKLEQRLANAANEIEELKATIQTQYDEVNTDALTGVRNRRYFDYIFDRAFAKCKDENRPLSLVVADIDHFKQFNDLWGHAAGDAALRLVGKILAENTKGKDIVARYGGEEFVIIAYDTTAAKALSFAEDLRRSVSERKLVKRSTGETLGVLTMSFGIADINNCNTTAQLFNRADKALYEAKNAGRNRVHLSLNAREYEPSARTTGRETDQHTELVLDLKSSVA